MQNPQQLSVPVAHLIRDDAANVRRNHTRDSVDSMKASILAHGILQPLTVRPPAQTDNDLEGQLYRVFAGGRRFRALSELVAEKKIAPEYPVPIVLRDADDRAAAEMSLTENVIRHAMSPVDEFRAFKDLADKGMSTEEIALRFGQTERFVRGRLALATVHPDILAAFERDEISFAAATAYTMSPDPERQAAFFNAKNNWQRDQPHSIKHNMRGAGAIRADSAVARAIGEEAYRAAGGSIVEDLFGEDSSWTSPDVVESLKAETFERFKKEALADGWSFVETLQEFGIPGFYSASFLQPKATTLTEDEAARMDKISDELEGGYEPDTEQEAAAREALEREYAELEGRAAEFSPEQKAQSGILWDMERFEWRPGAVRKIASAGQNTGSRAGSSSSANPVEAKVKDPLALTQSLRDIVGDTATAALRAAVEGNPHLALAFLATMLQASKSFGMGHGKPSRIKVETIEYGVSGDGKPVSIKTMFGGFAKMEAETLGFAVAGLIAGTVDLSERWFAKDATREETRDSTRQDFLQAFSANPSAAFDVDAYLGGCSKAMLDAASTELTGHACAHPKKSDMVREVAEVAKKRGWLPQPLRLKGYKLRKA